MTNLFLFNIITFLLMLICILLLIAYYTLIERQLIGMIQRRQGPRYVGLMGLFQAISDGLKLLLKETSQLSGANLFLFLSCPSLAFLLSMFSWAVIPFGFDACFIRVKFDFLFILAASTFHVYAIILAGWASNSRYPLIASLRVSAQLISYEIALTLAVLPVLASTGAINLQKIVAAQTSHWFALQHWPMFLVFFLIVLAETNRHPFDFAEAESELVSGFNVEFSAFQFALFFLAEYANMILMSFLTSLLFLGGWNLPLFQLPYPAQTFILSLKTLLIMLLFVVVRATLPRSRFDYLMSLGWKTCIPLISVWIVFTLFILFICCGLPPFGGYAF